MSGFWMRIFRILMLRTCQEILALSCRAGFAVGARTPEEHTTEKILNGRHLSNYLAKPPTDQISKSDPSPKTTHHCSHSFWGSASVLDLRRLACCLDTRQV